MARTKAEVPALPTLAVPPTLETPTLETPAAPASPAEPVTPAAPEPEVTGDGPFKVRHKVSGGEFEVSAEYLAMYRETLEVL